MRLSRKNKGLKKRIAAFVMAVLMTATPVLPCIDAFITAYAEFAIPDIGGTGNITMNVNSWCIDRYLHCFSKFRGPRPIIYIETKKVFGEP